MEKVEKTWDPEKWYEGIKKYDSEYENVGSVHTPQPPCQSSELVAGSYPSLVRANTFPYTGRCSRDFFPTMQEAPSPHKSYSYFISCDPD